MTYLRLQGQTFLFQILKYCQLMMIFLSKIKELAFIGLFK